MLTAEPPIPCCSLFYKINMSMLPVEGPQEVLCSLNKINNVRSLLYRLFRMRNTIVYKSQLNKFVLIPKGVTPKAGSSSPGEIDCCLCLFASIRPINTIKEFSAKGQKACFDVF